MDVRVSSPLLHHRKNKPGQLYDCCDFMVWPLQTMFTQMLRDSDSTKQIFLRLRSPFLNDEGVLRVARTPHLVKRPANHLGEEAAALDGVWLRRNESTSRDELKKKNNKNKTITSSYMNWRVRADLPTPPLPTMMTLWTIGWVALAALDAIFDCCWTAAGVFLVLPGSDGEGGGGASSNSKRCSCVQQRRNVHLLAADWLWLDDVVVVRWTLLLVVTLLRVLDDDADGQANVKILEWLGSSAFCLRSWMAWAMEIRTELGHLVTDWRIDSQFSLTLTRIFQIKSR